MPRDFKSFANENKNVINENKEKVNDYQEILDKYKNMNQDDLMSNLFKEASNLRSQGKLDNDTLNSLKSSLTPFLNNEQQEMLNNLIKAIDK